MFSRSGWSQNYQVGSVAIFASQDTRLEAEIKDSKRQAIYLSTTEGNLTEAQNYVKTLAAEAEATESQRSSRKSR